MTAAKRSSVTMFCKIATASSSACIRPRRASNRNSSTPRELCRNLGDGADQAAWLSVGVTISMPLENLTPAITFGK